MILGVAEQLVGYSLFSLYTRHSISCWHGEYEVVNSKLKEILTALPINLAKKRELVDLPQTKTSFKNITG